MSDSARRRGGHAYLFRRDGTLDPGAGRQYVSYSFSPDLGRLSGHLQVRCGNEPRELDGRYAVLLARLHRPLAREPAARPARRRHRRRHPRPHREPVQRRLLRAQHPHLRRRRGRLPREPQRPGARDPRLSGGEQRSDDRAAAGVLRGPRGRHDLPPRPRHPRRHELPGLQRRGHRDDLPEQQQSRRRDDRRPGRRRDPGQTRLGERGRPAGRPDERPYVEHHGRREQVHLVLPRPGEPAGGPTPCQGDAGFYGASGPFINGTINDTNEPANGSAPAERLTSTRTTFFDAPGSANGPLRHRQVTARLTTNLDPRPPRRPPPARPHGTPPAGTPPPDGGSPPKATPALKLSLALRYRRGRGSCRRHRAVLTLSGTGLSRVLRAGLVIRKRTLATDRARPFRVTVTKKRLRGHRRALVTVKVRLRGGKLVTLKRRVRGALLRPRAIRRPAAGPRCPRTGPRSARRPRRTCRG